MPGLVSVGADAISAPGNAIVAIGENTMPAKQRIERARTRLVLDHPFFGALALRLCIQEDASCPTACTNGVYIRYNPQFIGGLTDPELTGLVAHEVCHCAAGHFWRRSSRDASRWNVATDYEINSELIRNGFTLPSGDLVDPTMTGQSAETIYDQMPKQTGQTGQQKQTGQQTPGNGPQTAGPAPDPGNCGGVEDGPADTDDAGNGLREQWQVATVQAAKAAKAYGKLPGMGQRLLDELTRPALPWQTILADFVQRTARNDYSWQRINRVHAQRGIFMPGVQSNELPAVVVAVDTSGSIDQETLAAFTGAVSDILATYQTVAHVVFCDSHVQRVDEYRSEDLPIRWNDAPGGGGTDFRPVFDWIEKEGIEPAALVYLTDGYGSFPADEPDYPTIWAMTTDYDPPFGETVRLADAN